MRNPLVFTKDTALIWSLAAAGALVGIVQLLSNGERITARLLIIRALLHGILGVAAAAVTIVVPDVSFSAQVGLACIMSSIGTSVLERIFQRVVGK